MIMSPLTGALGHVCHMSRPVQTEHRKKAEGEPLAVVRVGSALLSAHGMQVPVKEREKLLKKEGLDPTRLANLTLVYKVQEVSSAGFASLASRLVKPCGATSALCTLLTELHSEVCS